MKTSIGIVGAGLLGRTTALELSRRNYRVTLFDRDSRAGVSSCSYTGAGMLAPFCELDVSDPLIFALGENSVAQWKSIVDSLPLPVFVQNEGTLVIAHGADSALLKQFHGNLSRKEAKVAQQVVWLNARQVAAVEPALDARFDGAYFARAEGQIDNRQLLDALAAGLHESNCEWLTDLDVLSVSQNEVHTLAEKFNFDFVIDCRGLGAKKQFANLRGVRGEIIALHSTEVVLRRPVRVLHPRYSIYVVPRQNQNFLIGATSLECEDYSNISVLSTLELLSAAFSLEPAFANANVVETRVNCRPALSNNLPSIRVRPGLIEANGLHRHGFLVTPSIVLLIVGLIEGVPHDSRFERLFDFRDEVEDSASKNLASENVVLQNLAAKTLAPNRSSPNRSAPETLEFACN